MNTAYSPSPAALGSNETGAPARRLDGFPGLAAVLLAAAVAALVVLADQMISTWVDGHLFFGWVALWVVIFAGTALFAGSTRRLARSLVRSTRAWAAALAEARNEVQLWNLARSDHRLMGELMQACRRDTAAPEEDVGPAGWGRYPERSSEERERQIHLRHR